jgi:hypothetical protein
MAVGIYVALSGMTADKYKENLELLRQAGAYHPPGRSFHAAFGPSDKLMVFDVWNSQAAFEQFGKTLLPILQQLGIDPGQLNLNVHEIHNVIKPPAKRPKAKKRASAKRASKRASAKRSPAKRAKRRPAKKR